MGIPDYKRVILANVTSLTPEIMQQLKDNQEFLRWHYDNLPKGLIARSQNNNPRHIASGGASPITVLSVSGVPLKANRIYKATVTMNGVSATQWNYNSGLADPGKRGSPGEIKILRDGAALRTHWVAGAGQVSHPTVNANMITVPGGSGNNYMVGSFGKIEALDFIYTDLPSAQYDIVVQSNGNAYYYDFNSGVLGNSPGSGFQINDPTNNDWWFEGATGQPFFSNYTLAVEDMGSFNNDPWQYGGL